jgi:hypothetical protein
MAGSNRQQFIDIRDMTDDLSADEYSEENAAAWVKQAEKRKQKAELDRLLINYPSHAALIRIFRGYKSDEQLSMILAHRFFEATNTTPEALPDEIQALMKY